MIKTTKDIEAQVLNIKDCIHHTCTDLLDDPNATKYDLIAAVIEGVYQWEKGMIIALEEEKNNEK